MLLLSVVAATLLPLRLAVSASSPQLIDPLSKDNSAQCDCYLASGPDAGYFQYYRFWDFRDIPSSDDDDYTVAPDLVTGSEANGTASVTSSYFNTSTFQADWAIQVGAGSSDDIVPRINSAQNVYMSRNQSTNSTYLTLRTNRLDTFQSVAEMDSNQMNVLHSSIRGRFRIIPNGLSNSSAPSDGDTTLDKADAGSNASHPIDDGAVFGFFTYHSDTQESDIEILTSDPTDNIRYSNQPDWIANQGAVPGASTQATMPDGTDYTQWLEHRLDWFADVSRWYVNDQLVLNKTVNVPSQHSGFVINLWSNGDTWSGNMSVGGQVTVGIEWIEMLFNVSGKVNGQKRRSLTDLWKRQDEVCHVGCYVDGVNVTGVPELAFNTTSAAFSLVREGNGMRLSSLYAMVTLLGTWLVAL